MSPRPRTVSDEAILETAVNVVSRLGPERFTLADVGAEVGLSAATLVQRFGSKRILMFRLLEHAVRGIDDRFNAAIAAHQSPLEALYAAAVDRSATMASPVTLSNMIVFYLSDLDDPEFHALARENNGRAVDGYRNLLERAIEAGEIGTTHVDTRVLAEAIYSMTMGSLITWSVTQDGPLSAKIQRDLDILLKPFRRGPRKVNHAATNWRPTPSPVT